jgi:MoaA/NifB/PqqE/SkfB family radical SAM enzyme
LLDKPALNSLIVSVDGATAGTHDLNRGKGMYERTIANLRKVTAHPRYKERRFFIEMAFVMTGINYHETNDVLFLALETGVTHLNVKNVRFIGRANLFGDVLGFSKKELLDTYASLIHNWMLTGMKLELEVFIPPAFATYLNTMYGFDLPTTAHPACGGIQLCGPAWQSPALPFFVVRRKTRDWLQNTRSGDQPDRK